MRIRKNARLITPASSSSSSSFLVCQLNRSPWDVDSFNLQGEWNGLNNGEIIQSSNSFPESMELSFEYVEKSLPPPLSPSQSPPKLEEQIGSRKEFQHIHHLLKLPPLCSSPPKKRGRPKKQPETTPTMSPYSFYDYSGFGPQCNWTDEGRQRNNSQKSPYSSSSSNCKDKEKEIDYIEDEFDEDEDDRFGGKRFRKPVKARSLKSLM
ncbi:uncharacterized protein LOC130811344 [Amaranthus tricolor]|uniref:uncharacterized protein LOC130811344 n=1 Tax=Amaranthus tricolor TaxID=29722 RepID=UPI00258D0673|nr:uncharacterized protein LOC130811344 [Amaranthus tricolor]